MAVFSGSFLSAELKRHTSVSVILPHDTSAAPPSGFPVLYLLHGKSDDNNSWLYRSNIERYATERGLCVIMPDVELSFYTNMTNGSKYFTYVLEELPEMVRNVLHVSMRREDTYIAGISMGGYGALKCAFTKPEKYGGCIALSPVTDIAAAMVRYCEDGEKQLWRGICGESLRVAKDIDLFRVLEDGAGLYSVFPKLYIACGKRDLLFDENIRLKEALDSNRIDFTFEQAAADHEWGFWDVAIQRGLDVVMNK